MNLELYFESYKFYNFRDFSRIFLICFMNLFGFIWNLKRIKIIKISHADVAIDAAMRKMCHHVAADNMLN